MIKRSGFFWAGGIGMLFTFYVSCSVRQSDDRPNILFCISDDQSFPHASAYGCEFVSTPAFDLVAGNGILFNNGFVAAPSCGPSRASILTGKAFYQLGEASMNHKPWPAGLRTYTDLLSENGYHVGSGGKGWGPGKFDDRRFNPAGKPYTEIINETPGKFMNSQDYAANFNAFLEERDSRPFCYWFGPKEPHRPLEWEVGIKHGKKTEDINEFPGFLPESDTVKKDILDYAFEIEWYDRHLMRMLDKLEEIGELENTIIVVTSDNGMAFPRGKPNVYQSGTHVPLAVSWAGKITPGQVSDALVSITDFAPTFLEAAGIKIPEDMTSKSLISFLTGKTRDHREFVTFGLERHGGANRPGSTDFPTRAIRTRDYLYIKNYHPDNPPLGELEGPVWPPNDPTPGSGWSDGGPSKTYLFNNKDKYPELFNNTFVKRPAEELYDVKNDPYQLNNLAGGIHLKAIKDTLSAKLDEELKRTQDPRILGNEQYFADMVNKTAEK